jgi:hypothetical protein
MRRARDCRDELDLDMAPALDLCPRAWVQRYVRLLGPDQEALSLPALARLHPPPAPRRPVLDCDVATPLP